MTTLKPCPFCGGKGTYYYQPDLERPELKHCHNVCCDRCAATTGIYISKEEAIAAWNRRAEPENEPLTLEELRQAKESKDPVWMNRSKQWTFVASVADAPYAQVWYFTAKGMVQTVLYHHETFYRRKPERSEG